MLSTYWKLGKHMRCPKCGLEENEQHALEYYSGCSRCYARIQKVKLPSDHWKHTEGVKSAPLRGDCFCQVCGKLMAAPSQYCLSCETKVRNSGSK